MARTGPLLLAIIAVCFLGRVNGAEYLGKFLGQLSQLHHGVSGEVYAVDGRTLHIKDFTYDGQGPAAYFYASTYKTADSRGFRLRDENNNGDVIRRYRKEHVTLTLPEGKTLNNIKIFYVWCEEFDVNFGDIKIPRTFDFPRPQKIDALKGVHAISSDNIVIVDAQTLLIPNLHYDGEAPDAKFWAGRGPKPSPQGIRVPDENGKEVPLRRYDGKTIVLTLPGDLTVFDIGHFGIWCEQFTVDFGHIQIPQNLNIPPSLKMLGVSPQSKLNCEVLNDELAFEVRWAVAGESIVLQLVGKLNNREYMSFGLSGDDSKSVMIGGDVVVAWVDKETLKGYAQDYYLGDKSQCSGPTGSCPDAKLGEHTNNIRLLNAAMVNGYSIVTYQRPLKASDEFDLPIYTNQSQAIIWAIGPLNQRDEVSFHSSYLKRDSFIDFARPAKWNCPLPEGETTRKPASIENRQQYTVSDEIAEPLPTQPTKPEPVESSSTTAPRREAGNRRRGGGTRIATRQPIATADEAEEGQATIKEPTRTRGSNRVNQRGTPSRTVPPPTPVNNRNAWYIPPIQCYEPEDGVFYAQMGPTGGKRGYPAITGHVGWGISWYINGLLIPEINVVRGKTYTFVVEGGDDPEVSAKYHPFYITDDPIGGYAYKTPEEQKQVRILAGVRRTKDGSVHPTGTGRLCHWTHTGDSEADDFDSFGAYQRTLQLKCDGGEPGFIQWTPDKDTPDTVYYQCFTHRHLGWKINVLDSCDVQGAASEPKPSIVEAPDNLELFSDQSNIELEASASIQQETRVIPNNIITEESSSDNKISQPTVSETLTTLDSPTPTSQSNPDKIPNTSFLFQSQQNHLIDPLSQVTSFALPYHTSGHYVNYNKDASSFRPSPTIDALEDILIKTPKRSVVKRMNTKKSPLTNFIPKVSTSNTQTDSTTNTNFTYIALPLNIASKFNNNNFKNIRSAKQPLQLLYMPLNQPTRSQNLQYSTTLNGYKSSFFRQIPPKMHTSVLYNTLPEFKHKTNFKTSQIKPQLLIHTLKDTSPMQTQFIPEVIPLTEIKNVEISPQQASTEREPEIQTASSLISVHPVPHENFNFKTPVNTGFNPGSVIIEGGFRPIISKDIEERVDYIEPEVDLQGQIGVLEVKGKKFESHDKNDKLTPVFVLSPSDKVSKHKHKMLYQKPVKKDTVKIVVLPRNFIDSDIELEMAAADKVESFYLPPPGQTKKPKTSAAKQPSEIDFDSPVSNLHSYSGPSLLEFAPDTVVTYDGKKVSGASLTAKPFEKSNVLEQRGSKATELIKAHPQSVPFKGDLPPLNQNVLFNVKTPNPNTHTGVLSRNLDTPLPPPSGYTKLTRVRRAAHHTPEHTAEQMRLVNQTKINSTTSGSKSLMQFSIVSLILSMVFVRTYI